MDSWRYYNHALIPNCAPHEVPNIDALKNESTWNSNGKALLARWTTDYDCGYETSGWYVVKDCAFDISALKAKRRYEINKGLNNFSVCRISPIDYAEQLYAVTVEAYSAWPEKYRPQVDHDRFIENLPTWSSFTVYGAFSKIDGSLCGYALLKDCGSYLDFSVLRTIPASERLGVNAAIVASILEGESAFLEQGRYICDGTRSMRHETAFQDYLEKYFGFRKAYCTLNIRYRKGIGIVIKLLYPVRGVLKKFNSIGIVNSVLAILAMEEINREQTAKNKNKDKNK